MNTVFWPCGSFNNRRFGGTYRLHYSSETSVLTRATWRNIPEDGFLNVYSVHETNPPEDSRIATALHIRHCTDKCQTNVTN
jgi:hypothetical protein